ncbi:exodeoxyribonuclease VII large subunit [Formicincola oecophyllae]|uniref:Exodeoxyribonuclease 7 large subunit n=1 Tax=Formicincola oecophyllae TaxID=2558361 RepID=A0A4Y6UBC8_9PROT|nr:exodeoxyribonuclease VII large subunit [Formicincola oecophyllae]
MSNVAEYTVSALSSSIKQALEGKFGRVRVRGEITDLRQFSSGHAYLSLKDEQAKIAAVVWRGNVAKLGMELREGQEVIATGRISTYGERSTYQLIIDRMEYAGEGALLARVEVLRRQILAEGLFAEERKKPLPFLPARIAVVTSRSGAVVHDIFTTLARRFPSDVVLCPVPVQGKGAESAIAAGIRMASTLHPRPDVMIVARGGGSLEDLMAFNDEAVVRAIAEAPMPVISAIGHETDTTLADYAADRRAPTPTAAAEMAVPQRSAVAASLAQQGARLVTAWDRGRQDRQLRLQNAARQLPDLPTLLNTLRMKLDDRAHRLDLTMPQQLAQARHSLAAAARALPTFARLLHPQKQRLEALGAAMNQAMARHCYAKRLDLSQNVLSPALLVARVKSQKALLTALGRNLEAFSPFALRDKGYVLVRDAEGRPVTRSAQLPLHAEVSLDFMDGTRRALLDPE